MYDDIFNFPACECSGPTTYYKEIGCTPVFENEGDLCPKRYNCDHLKNLPNDKCIVNGHEYDVGPYYRNAIRLEDSRPCDKNCFCVLNSAG